MRTARRETQTALLSRTVERKGGDDRRESRRESVGRASERWKSECPLQRDAADPRTKTRTDVAETGGSERNATPVFRGRQFRPGSGAGSIACRRPTHAITYWQSMAYIGTTATPAAFAGFSIALRATQLVSASATLVRYAVIAGRKPTRTASTSSTGNSTASQGLTAQGFSSSPVRALT